MAKNTVAERLRESMAKRLRESKEAFLKESYDLGVSYADDWLKDCDDYASLTRIVGGHSIEVPEDLWEEVTSRETVEDFGGSPDAEAFSKGFNDALFERKDEIAAMMNEI